MPRRLTGMLVGVAYAVIYGFWTMFITGGGHGNFIWFVLFVVTYFFGLMFPAMGFLVVDLRPILAKSTLATLIIVQVILTWMLLGPRFLDQEGSVPEDIISSWERSPVLFLIMSVVHVLPTLAMTGFLFKSLFFDITTEEEEEKPVSLRL